MNDTNYAHVFNRLSHMVALSKEGKTKAAIDNLVITIFAIDQHFVPTAAHEVAQAISDYFELSLGDGTIQSSVDRLLADASLLRQPGTNILTISPQVRSRAENRIIDASTLERQVRDEWSEEVKHCQENMTRIQQDELWNCLRAYLAKAFERHGAQATMLLNPAFPLKEEHQKSLSTYMRESFQEACRNTTFENATAAVRLFLSSNTPIRTKYLAQLLDATFTFFALTVDDATSSFLRSSISPLSLFLDTNFIFGILELHINPLNEVSRELVGVIKKLKLPFRLYYHEATLAELERTVFAIGEDLKASRYTQALSRAAVKSGRFRGIELRYHEKNSESPLDPDIFLTKYKHIPQLLGAQGFEIYRVPSRSKELDQERFNLVAEYQSYLEEFRPQTVRTYEAINHDIIVWQSVRSLRKTTASALDAGAFFLTADSTFYGFDWRCLRKENNLGYAILPNQFLQILRPFVPATEDFNRRFVDTLAIPEFRTIGTDYSLTAAKVLQYFSTYSDVSEGVAARILADEMLLQQLSGKDEQSEEFRALIENRILEENELLFQSNQALRTQEAELRKRSEEKESEAKQKQEELAVKDTELTLHAQRSEKAEAAALVASEREAEAQRQANLLQGQMESQSKALEQTKREKEHYAFLMRVGFSLLFAVVGSAAIFIRPLFLQWEWLDQHPYRLSLYVGASLGVLLISWAIVDEKRRWIAIIPIVGGIVGAIVQVLGR